MIDSITPHALKYIMEFVLENEEVKKFPKDFVTASMKWIRSWFLDDDSTAKAVIESKSPAIAKEAVLGAKLNELLKNPQFKQELKANLEYYTSQQERIKNIAKNAKIESEGGVHIGDKGFISNDSYTRKNEIQDSVVKAKQDFHLGDNYLDK